MPLSNDRSLQKKAEKSNYSYPLVGCISGLANHTRILFSVEPED